MGHFFSFQERESNLIYNINDRQSRESSGWKQFQSCIKTMTREEFKNLVSLYPTDWMWSANEATDSAGLDKLAEEFKKRTQGKSPIEYAVWVLWGYLTQWKRDVSFEDAPLSRFNFGLTAEQYGPTNRMVRFQTGTCRSNAEAFIREGLGFTQLQSPVGDSENYLKIERLLGIQVSIPGACRGGIDRLEYYASRKAEAKCDSPAVLCGLIPECYLWANPTNSGEYGISIRDYDKIVDPEILSLGEYEKKYLK